jgi:hypothetical protein
MLISPGLVEPTFPEFVRLAFLELAMLWAYHELAMLVFPELAELPIFLKLIMQQSFLGFADWLFPTLWLQFVSTSNRFVVVSLRLISAPFPTHFEFVSAPPSAILLICSWCLPSRLNRSCFAPTDPL